LTARPTAQPELSPNAADWNAAAPPGGSAGGATAPLLPPIGDGFAASNGAMPRSRVMRKLTYALMEGLRYWLLVVLVIVWQFVSTRWPSVQPLLPPPTDVFAAGVDLIARGSLQQDILASLKRVGVALLAASIVGIPLGAAVGGSARVAWSLEPVVNFIRPIPPLAWIPLSIMWFGIGDAQNEFIIFLAAVFPMLLNTMDGVRNVDPQLIRAAKTLGATRTSIVLTVILPAALPSMFVGLRIGTGIAWMALVAGEIVAASSGLGYLINQGRFLFRSDYIIVGMVVIGVIGLMLDASLRLLQAIVMPWRAKQ
jgi:ABC-type nitrate/sulfonate/bicarbonate transport system permease component